MCVINDSLKERTLREQNLTLEKTLNNIGSLLNKQKFKKLTE